MRFLLITLIQHFWFLLGLNPFTTAFREIHIPGFPPMDLPDDFGCLPNRSTDTKVACEKFDCEHQVNDFKTAPLAGKKPAKLQKKKSGGTPRKTNMSPENHWLEDVFPTTIVPFLGTC